MGTTGASAQVLIRQGLRTREPQVAALPVVQQHPPTRLKPIVSASVPPSPAPPICFSDFFPPPPLPPGAQARVLVPGAVARLLHQGGQQQRPHHAAKRHAAGGQVVGGTLGPEGSSSRSA